MAVWRLEGDQPATANEAKVRSCVSYRAYQQDTGTTPISKRVYESPRVLACRLSRA